MRHSSSRRWIDPIRTALGFTQKNVKRTRKFELLRLEERALPSSAQHTSFTTVDRGDYYSSASANRIQLLERVGEYAVRLSSETTIGAITTKGLFANFTVERHVDTDIYILRSDTGTVPAGPTGSEFVWVAPLFQTKGADSWSIATNEIIVALKPGVTASQFFTGDNRFSSYRPLIGTPDQFVATVAAGAGRNALAVTDSLAHDARLNWSAPNFYQDWQTFFTPNDPVFPEQWHLNNTGQHGTPNADVDAPEAWNVVQGGSPTVIIAVVDTGMEYTHPDLAPNLAINTGEIANNGIDDDGNGYIDDRNGWDFTSNDNTPTATGVGNDHATAVAGVAAARGENNLGVAGIAYKSRILPVRIFGDTGGATSDANLASAVYYAAGRTADGMGTWRGADIENNSWGGNGLFSQAIQDAFTWASNQGRGGKGVISFISSGNSGIPSIAFPSVLAGTLSGVISVGASNDLNQQSFYSQFGPQLDFLSPSDGGTFGIVTTDRQGANGYNPGNYTVGGEFGGTSSASPLAAGIGALVLARDPNLTASQVRGLMRNTTDLIDPANARYDASTGFSLRFGYGKVNAFGAVSGVGIAKAQVLNGSTVVANGPGVVNFGTVTVGGFADVTLHLRNQGTEILNLTDVNIAAGPFTLSQAFGSTTLAVGQSTTFKLRFMPTAVPVVNRTITITTNDPSSPSYTFTLRGGGQNPSIAGTIYEDWSANAVRNANDPGLAGAIAYLDTNANGSRDLVESAYDSTDVPKSIPDANPAGVTSNLVIPDVGLVGALTVTLSISHTWDSDLTVTLISPTGKRVQLFSGVGDDGDDFTGTTLDDSAAAAIGSASAPFSGTFRPAEPLSRMLGEPSNGTWKLEAIDSVAFDVGMIESWTLNMTVSEPFATTDGNGFYAFLNLPAGSYSVGQDAKPGFHSTGPATNYTVPLPANGSITGRDFGQIRTNAIYGVQFGDTDSNGIKNSGEPLLPGWTVFLDKDNDGVFDTDNLNDYSSTDVPKLILDGDRTLSVLPLSGVEGTITDLNVTLTIAHSYDQDLAVTLIGPDGTRVKLFEAVGGSGQNFTDTVLDDQAATPIEGGTAPFTGSFRPMELLSVFNGQSANGLWQLEVVDNLPGDTGNLFAWTLNVAHTEPYAITDALGDYRFDTLAAGNYFIRELPLPGLTLTAPVSGAFNVPLANGAFIVDRDFGVHADVAPTVTNVTVGDGTAQRSRVTQLKVAFSTIINFIGSPSAAFRVDKIVGGVPSGTVALTVTTAIVGGHTEATIRFTSDTTSGSLNDGRYRLTVLANQVTSAGTPMAIDNVTNFHRFYGDSNGDARVDIGDFGLFSGTFSLSSSQTGFLSYFDFNNDGRIDIVDFGQFSLRFFTTLP
jgi:subtilisin-like proprotein convertase family protein